MYYKMQYASISYYLSLKHDIISMKYIMWDFVKTVNTVTCV